MRKRPIAAALCTLLAAACAAGPDYRRPTAPASAGEAFVTRAEGIDPASPLPDDWWRLYNDPVLDDLVARAFAANTDLRAASANLAKARASCPKRAPGACLRPRFRRAAATAIPCSSAADRADRPNWQALSGPETLPHRCHGKPTCSAA